MKQVAFILVIFLLSFSLQTTAQINFKVNLSQKHLNKVEKAKNGRNRLKKYRKLYTKDSTKAAKRYDKMMDKKLDSLHNAYKQKGKLAFDTLDMPFDTSGYSQYKQLPDSAALDSMAQARVAEYLKANYGLNGGYEELIMLQDSTIDRDSLLIANGSARMNDVLAKTASKHSAGKLGSEHSTLMNQVNELQTIGGVRMDSLHQTDMKQVGLEQAKTYAMQTQAIQKAQLKMKRMKMKYSYLPNSNDPSTAIKRTSLKDKPFKQRLYFGGTFNVASTSPIVIDFSPQVGYRFNTKFVVGASFTYRENFGTDSLSRTNQQDAYGFGFFANYDIMKGFFAYAEQENLKQQKLFNSEKSINPDWKRAYLIGVGRGFNISSIVNGKVVLLYNFGHTGKSQIYPRRWVVKMGFDLDRRLFSRK